MNLLHRVLYGRVAKQRPAPTDRHEGDRPKAYSGSTTQFRQVQSSSPRASSTITGLNTAGDPSAKNGQSSQVGDASTTRMPIKEEDDNDKLDPVSMFSAQGDHVDILAEIGRPEGHIAKSEGLSIDASLISPVKRESTKEGSFERHANEEAFLEENSKDANEGQSREDDTAEELYATGIHYFNSDEPIPSIEEEDGDVGEMEQSRKRRNTPPFLHGMTHRLDRTSESILEDGLAEGMEDEDFEEELGGEVEENLLIDEKDLRYWLHHKHSTAGIQGWPSEACRLYKLLFLRGLYPIFGSQWTWNFLDHPMPGELFTPLGSDDKCLLKAEKSDYHASKALIRLFNLHGYVSDYRQCGMQTKIAPLIEQEIKRYVHWSERDGDFVKKHDYVSPIFVITYKNAQAASTGQPIVERCQALVGEYRSLYAVRGIRDYPRCVFIFVVVQHIVLVMVADTEHLDEDEPYPLAELDLSQRSHWLDYSLGIVITVMLAKESLLAHRWAFPTIQVVEDDPDL